MLDAKDLKVGEEYWAYDGFGIYDKIVILKELHTPEGHGFPCVEARNLKDGSVDLWGGISGYGPSFYPKDWD